MPITLLTYPVCRVFFVKKSAPSITYYIIGMEKSGTISRLFDVREAEYMVEYLLTKRTDIERAWFDVHDTNGIL